MTSSTKTIPPLENGDQLTRAEFEQRYESMSQLKKAELIEGIVYMPAALRFRKHGKPHAQIIAWLGFYTAATPGIELGDNATVRLDADNAPQPDALLRIEGGQTIVSEDDYVEGAPELIVEIAASSASYDLHDKLKAYRRNQVQEYLVWRVYDREFDWFCLRSGKYISLQADELGLLKSEIFPGLWLDKNSLLKGNLAEVFKVLQQGIASADHQEFTAKLLGNIKDNDQ